MQDPEAYLRALTAPLATTQEGGPLPVARFSLEAVANAFVILGLLPAARAEQILAAGRVVLQGAGLRLLEGRTTCTRFDSESETTRLPDLSNATPARLPNPALRAGTPLLPRQGRHPGSLHATVRRPAPCGLESEDTDL
jgi:hypothetical protein